MPQKGPGPIPANSMILMPFSGPAMMLSCSSDPFDDDRGCHAARGAHGDEAVAAARALEFVERGADQDRAGGADRMAERHRAAVDVHLLAGQVEVADELFRSEEHTTELQSLMRISYAVFCLKNKNSQQSLRSMSTK